MLALSVVHCALAFSGSALLAYQRREGVAAVRGAVVHVCMHDAGTQRELRALRTPEVAAISSKNEVRKGRNYKTEIQVPQKRPLIKINTSVRARASALRLRHGATPDTLARARCPLNQFRAFAGDEPG
jgi:hypothetical protein